MPTAARTPAKKRIDSKPWTIGELLRRPAQYVVPANQRDFSWKLEEVDTLWTDLMDALARGSVDYFLGAIVIARSSEKEGTFEIIDGQQRLACLTMVMAAIYFKWKERGDDRDVEVQRDYLGARDRATRELLPKLSLNETNDPVFQRVVLAGKTLTAPERKTLQKSNRLMIEAFERIKGYLDTHIGSGEPEEALIEIEQLIAQKTSLIVIEVEDDIDAFTIFETLNDRGMALAVSDLVKNYLFSVAEDKLETFKKAWSDIALLVGNENLTVFLRHLWLSEYEFARERELYRLIREKIRTKANARQFIDKLRKAADLYSALMNPESSYWGDVPAEAPRYLATLKLFRAIQFRPLALAVMDGGTPEEVAKMLRIVTFLTFRYTIVSGYGANELERIYSNAAQQVRKLSKRNPKAIFDLVKDAYVEDSKFEANFAGASFPKADVARYTLTQLNQAMLPPGRADGVDVEKISLEHILTPSAAAKPGAIPKGDSADDWIDRIGNLTLLERGVNRGLGAKDFAYKKANAYGKSGLALNEPLVLESTWESKEIQKRSATLAGLAKKVWRLDYP